MEDTFLLLRSTCIKLRETSREGGGGGGGRKEGGRGEIEGGERELCFKAENP